MSDQPLAASIQKVGLEFGDFLKAPGRFLVFKDREEKMVIKSFVKGNRCDGAGHWNGFVRSFLVPLLAPHHLQSPHTQATEFLDVYHFAAVPTYDFEHDEGAYWYAMKDMKLECDWRDKEVVEKAVNAIIDLQQVDYQAFLSGNRDFDLLKEKSVPAPVNVKLLDYSRFKFTGKDFGTRLNYSKNLCSSWKELLEKTEDREQTKEVDYALKSLLQSMLNVYAEALNSPTWPNCVLAHRDTGKGNFRMDEEGRIALIDFEHCRPDNPLTDYVHLWIKLKEQKDLKLAADYLLARMKDLHGKEQWFRKVLALCIVEKVLGTLNSRLRDVSVESSKEVIEAGEALDQYLEETELM